jgi:hypothetical protein
MNQETRSATRQVETPGRRYPRLDAALETETPAILDSFEISRSELDRLSRAGTERERDRARAALLAYQRALEMYYYLAELRDRGVSQH